VYAPKERHFLGFVSDITEREKAHEQIVKLSYNDQLTGLYNRRFYEEELKRLDTKRNLPIALIMVDVNGLKITNDAFGHQEGDALLKLIAQILKTNCRSDEILSRIGGDEFVILLPRTGAIEANNLIARINDSVVKESEKTHTLSLSIGYAVKENESDSMNEVFKKAEDDMYRHKLSESYSMRSKTIDLIMSSLYEKSDREMQHSKRVSEICESIASSLYYTREETRQIKLSGLVHDIGKIGISNLVLDKEGPLIGTEWEAIRKHSEAGYRILSSVREFSEIAEFVLCHHERWDGNGYPRGLKETEIPIQARIIAIADAYDAMTSDRTYRNRMDEFQATRELVNCAGTHFDPDITKIFVEKVLGLAWVTLKQTTRSEP
jgi:diguanylate cyclase